jgi:hypothetical protein
MLITTVIGVLQLAQGLGVMEVQLSDTKISRDDLGEAAVGRIWIPRPTYKRVTMEWPDTLSSMMIIVTDVAIGGDGLGEASRSRCYPKVNEGVFKKAKNTFRYRYIFYFF